MSGIALTRRLPEDDGAPRTRRRLVVLHDTPANRERTGVYEETCDDGGTVSWHVSVQTRPDDPAGSSWSSGIHHKGRPLPA